MRRFWPLLLAAGCASQANTSSPSGGSSQPADTPADAAADKGPTLEAEKYVLDNGLTVILHRDTRLPLVATSVWYHVGALNERPGRSGFAHLFEHMMFQGSPHVGEDQHFKILQQIGGTQMNGTTDFDRTNYFETVPANELETVLWLESDRMGFLLSSVTQEALKNQIDVVQNERRQSVVNRPYGLMSEKLTQTLYPKPHPYYGDVIGSMDDIGAATLDDVQDFFRTYYTPANASLVIAGSFETADVKAMVAKYFGPLKGRDKPAPVKIPAPKIVGEKVIDFEEPVGRLPKITVAWMGPSAYEKDAAALDVLAFVISGTRSSRLDRKVSHEDPLAQSVSAYFSEYASGGRFQIDIVTRPGRTLAEAQTAIDAVLTDLNKNPPTKDELQRALNAWETRTLNGLQQLGGFSGRAERLQTYEHYLGDPLKLAWDVERYRGVTAADLARVLKTYLNKNRVVLKATPKGS